MSDARDTRKDPAEVDDVEKTEEGGPGTVREPIESRDDGKEGEETPRHEVIARESTTEPEQKMTPGVAAPVAAKSGTGSDMWPDMTDLRERFDALQSEFIEDPKSAVTKAEGLISDVVERLTRSLHERMDSMHHGLEGTDDTEQLRQTMRGYRDLVVWMETHRAA